MAAAPVYETGPISTARRWNNRCELLPGFSTVKISATHAHRNRGGDNGPLCDLFRRLYADRTRQTIRDVQNRLICVRHSRAMAW